MSGSFGNLKAAIVTYIYSKTFRIDCISLEFESESVKNIDTLYLVEVYLKIVVTK